MVGFAAAGEKAASLGKGPHPIADKTAGTEIVVAGTKSSSSKDHVAPPPPTTQKGIQKVAAAKAKAQSMLRFFVPPKPKA